MSVYTKIEQEVDFSADDYNALVEEFTKYGEWADTSLPEGRGVHTHAHAHAQPDHIWPYFRNLLASNLGQLWPRFGNGEEEKLSYIFNNYCN